MSDQEANKRHFTIDVVSDVMCPWCHIGRKRLNDALSEIPENIEVTVNWLPFQLDATLPKEGKDRTQYFIDKFGSLDAHAQIYASIYKAGQDEGIPFLLDDIKVSPNTFDAHRLIYWAGRDYSTAVQNRLVGILMRFYFEEARHIGEDATLVEAAEMAGMDGAATEKMLKSDQDTQHVQQQITSIQSMGVSGVPFFIVDNKYALPGAQSKDNIIRAIQTVISENQ